MGRAAPLIGAEADPPPAEFVEADAPLIAETAVPVCDVCGRSGVTDEYATGYDYESLTSRNRWRFVRCPSCDHVWLNPRPSVEALNVIYPATYYAYNYEQLPKVVLKGKQLLDGLTMRKILRLCGSRPKTYLDVGCGEGRYLDALARRGVDPTGLFGLELEEDVVKRLRERGLQVFCERVEDCERFEPGTFDLITIFHVIEHVESPQATVDRMADWLAPGGVLALETPNLDSLDRRLFRSGTWGGFHIPRHWHLYTPKTMRRVLESAGLEVEAIKYQTGHAFWLFSFHHWLRYRRRPHRRMARFFDPFNGLKSLVPLVGFTGFDKVRAALGAKTSAMLFIARKPH